MKAIRVKYLPATNTKPSRLKAFTDSNNSITRSFDYEYRDGGTKQIAQALIEKLDWRGLEMIEGGLPNGDTVFVLYAKEG